jgi:tetratricopeptide (TPR) repeat protein
MGSTPAIHFAGVFFCLMSWECDVCKWVRNLSFFLLCALPAGAQAPPNTSTDLAAQFQSALAAFHTGQFPEAAAKLEKMLPQAPENFAVRELLGLVYASESEYPKAIEQLHKAVVLKPHDFDANHNLGEIYVRAGKIAEAIPLLEEAQKLKAASYENGYNLALAYFLTGRLAPAKQLIHTLLAQQNTGELHNLLAQVEEKSGDYLAAAGEFSTAAQMDPSEENLFDWGSEFLLHRTYDPSIRVFQQGIQRFPDSPRMWMGLGMAQSARGTHEEAIQSLLKAADLSPSDARCYRFLSHAYELTPKASEDVVRAFQHYAEIQPANSMAQYYYAISLLKGKSPEASSPEFQQAEGLLRKAIELDGKNALAHFRLGTLYADQHEFDQAFPQYEQTVALDPELPDVHYRLGQYYVHAGKRDLSQQEFAKYQNLRAKYLARLDQEGADVQQFVTSSKSAQ